MRKQIREKMLGVSFLMLFIFVSVPNQTIFRDTINKTVNSLKEDSAIVPQSAALSFYEFSINGTELYEDGIYYCFRNDTLVLNLNTSTDVTSVSLDIHHPSQPSENFATQSLSLISSTTTGKIWSLNFEISGDKATAMYNSTLRISDGVNTDDFLFNISIMNPQPRILRAYLWEPIYYGTDPIPLYEGEIYSIYHFEEMNVTCYIANIDGLSKIDTVQMIFENGNHINQSSFTLSSIGTTTLNGYDVTIYSLQQNLTIDMSNENEYTRANWTIGDRYSFSLVVNDTEGESFDFNWDMRIENHAPSITQFEVSPNIDASTFNTANRLNFSIYVNGSDVETDKMFGDTIYNITRTFSPSSTNILNNSRANITDWDDYDQALYKVADEDEYEQYFTFPSTAGAAYGANFTLGRNYDFNDADLYKDWYITMVIRITNNRPILNLQLYDYSTKSWVNISNNFLPFTTDSEVSVTFLNTSIYDQNIMKYFETENQTNTLQMRIVCESSGIPYDIGIDKIEMGFKVQRKVGFSDMFIKIYSPATDVPQIISIIDHYNLTWDGSGSNNRWALNYSIALDNKTALLRGDWSFIVEVYDFGTTPYSEISPIEENGINPLSKKSYLSSDKTRSYATQTKLLRVGLDDWTELLNVNNVAISDQTPDSSTNSTISVTLDDYDYSNSYKLMNYSYLPDVSNLQIQDGQSWDGNVGIYNVSTLPPGLEKQWNKDIDSSLILQDDDGENTSASSIFANDSKIFRFRVNKEDLINETFAWIIPYKLDMKYWLSEENISRIWFDITENAQYDTTLGAYGIKNASVQLWNFETGEWITPNEENTSTYWVDAQSNQDDFRLMKFDNIAAASETWMSTAWTNQTLIKQCIKETKGNLMYIRILTNLGASGTLPGGGINRPFNITVDYVNLTVEYKNEYWCKLKLWDNLNNNPVEYFMTQTATGTNTRTWSLELPTSIISARDITFSIEAQNGNSSIHVYKGTYQGAPTGYVGSTDYSWKPIYDSSIGANDSYVIHMLPADANINGVNYATITDLHRYQEHLLFNGTVSSRFVPDSYSVFVLQLRQYNMQSQSEWIEIEANNKDDITGTKIFTYDNQTGDWNVDLMFAHDLGGIVWRSGVWYYRIILRTNETTVNATDWGTFRLQNYQPRHLELTGLKSGSYYRVKDPVPYYFSFVDMEGDNSTFNELAGYEYNITISFLILNRDKNLQEEKWDSKTVPIYDNVTALENRFAFHGSVYFGREIQIGNYTDVYIRVQDQDIDWPQVGTKKITDRVFEILNNHPTVETYLTTNATEPGLENKVYRNNWIKIYTNITDIDDFDYQIKPDYFNMTYNIDYNGNTAIRDANNSIQLVNYTTENFKQWEFDLFVDRRNKTGIWNFTLNFHDPDGDHLSNPMDLSIEVLNNLPILQNLWFKNEQLNTIAYWNNETNFGVYRGNETLQITADIYDVEDTWISENGYQIKNVAFQLVNTYLPTNEIYTDDSFTLTLVQNGSKPDFQTSAESFDIYNVSSISAIDQDFQGNTLLTVQNQNGEAALTRDLENDDGNYHHIQFYYSIVEPKGGEYYMNITGLPTLFDLHVKNMIYNLSIKYQALQGQYYVYIYNIEEDSWDNLGSLTSTSWTTTNLSINSDLIRQYASESTNNVVQIKINSSIDQIEGTPGELNLELVHLSYYRLRDDRYEQWVGTITLPRTDILHSGALQFKLIMTDQDDGLGYDTKNTLNVYNARPTFDPADGLKIYDSNGNLLQRNSNNDIYYTPLSSNDNPYMEIVIHATDADGTPDTIGIKKIKVEGSYLADQFFTVYSKEYNATDVVDSDDPTIFRIRIYLSELKGEQIGWFELATVTIADFDDGYCNPTQFPTSNSITEINTKLYYKQETSGPTGANWQLIVGIVGGVAAVGLGFVFYRKFISYRKYLDKE